MTSPCRMCVNCALGLTVAAQPDEVIDFQLLRCMSPEVAHNGCSNVLVECALLREQQTYWCMYPR
jgi:hypothetical protein